MRARLLSGLVFCASVSFSLFAPGVAEAEDSAAQVAFRNQYVAKTSRKTREILDTGGQKARTTEENELISTHWGRAFRAIRIREIAQDENDPTTVSRVDGFLDRLDADYETKLRAAVAAAPDRPGAPKLSWPVNGAKLSLAKSHTLCRFQPEPNTVSYSCILSQTTTGHGHNYFCSHSGECFGDINDGRFKAGPAQIVAAQNLGGAWSAQTRVDVEIVEPLAAPTFEKPASNDSAPNDKPLAIRFADYPGATKFMCGIRQGYNSGRRETTGRDCELHPWRDGLNPGTATIWGQAFANDKWSETRVTTINLTGDKYPAPFIRAPQAGTLIGIDHPFNCVTDEYPGAVGYRCIARNGKHKVEATTGTSQLTTLTLNPAELGPGHGEVMIEAILPGGKKSEVAHVKVNFTKLKGL